MTTRGASAGRPWLSSYPEGVPADVEVPLVPVTRLLDDAAASYPDGVALAFHGASLDYRRLREQVDAFAAALSSLGVRQRDRVALVLPTCPQYVIALFAALRLGAVVVPLDPLSPQPELRHQLADCGARVVVCLDRVVDAIMRVRWAAGIQHVVVTSIIDYLPRRARAHLRVPSPRARRLRREISAPVPRGTASSFLALLRSSPGPVPQADTDPQHDLALLLYTSGTTGVSRGAMLTHANVVSSAHVNRSWDAGAAEGREVTLGVLPLSHAYGLTCCLMSSVLVGGTLVMLPRFDVDAVLDAVEAHRPTVFPGVPPIFQALAASPRTRGRDLSSLRVCVSGGMRLPVAVQREFERVTGVRLVEGYGLTEAAAVTHANPLAGERRPGTIGLPVTGTLARVVDLDDPTAEVPVGAPGELAVAGPQVFAGYWGHPDDEEGVFTHDGYLRTGDVAVMDDGGWFSLLGRREDLIVTDGRALHPAAVEQVLVGQPGVADAVVVGLPDPVRGQAVTAYVVPVPGARLDEQALFLACRSALPAHEVPRALQVRESLPRNAVGKVLRRVLLEQASGGPGRRAARARRVPAAARAVPAGAPPVDVVAPAAPPRPAGVEASPTAPAKQVRVRRAPSAGTTRAARAAGREGDGAGAPGTPARPGRSPGAAPRAPRGASAEEPPA